MGGIGNAIGAIGGFIQKAMPVIKAISSFVPGLGAVTNALSSFGQVSNAFKSLFSKNEQAERQAADQAEKTRAVASTIKNAADVFKGFKSGNAFKGIDALGIFSQSAEDVARLFRGRQANRTPPINPIDQTIVDMGLI